MIPITIVTGFLGSGKTSLIAHILDTATERRVAVVVNDLAPHSVDSAFLQGGEHIELRNTELIRSISGGRVGAGKRDALLDEIESVLTLDEPVEAIVIETSGSSPVLELAEGLQATKPLADRVYLDTVITVVDTGTFPDFWKDPLLSPLLADQIRAADLVVLNKYDRAGFWQRRKSRKIVSRTNPTALIGSAEHGRLPVNEVIITGRRGGAAGDAAGAQGGTNGRGSAERVTPTNPNFHPLVARFLKEERPFHPDRLDTWLNGEWPGLVRIKGFVWLASDMEHVYVIDVAGPQREIGKEGTWYAALPEAERPEDSEIADQVNRGLYGDRRQALTIIGVPDAVERELRNLRACLLSGPELDRGPTGWQKMTDPIQARFAAAEDEQA
ncbi:MAG: GTP-binding protein [Spirochaeta sp.]|jgi:G3E family GTPase|nr:GTP-binding protein [Spirochaeta sp.]